MSIALVMDMKLGVLWEMVRDMEAWCAAIQSQRDGHDWVTEKQQQHIVI